MTSLSELSRKLNPSRFDGMSPFMAGVVAYVLNEHWTDPEIAEITVGEQDGIVYLRTAGDVGFNHIRSLADLRGNWNSLINAAGWTDDERSEAVRLFRSRVATLAGTEL